MSTILQQIRARNAEARHQHHTEAGDIQSEKYGGTAQPTSQYGETRTAKGAQSVQPEHLTSQYGQSVQPEHPTSQYGETRTSKGAQSVQPASAGDIEDRLAAVEESNKALVAIATEMAAAVSHHQSALETVSEVPKALDAYLKTLREEQSKVNLDTALKIDMLQELVTDLQETIAEDRSEDARDAYVEDGEEEAQGLAFLGFSDIGILLEARPDIADIDGNDSFSDQLCVVLKDAADLGLISIREHDNAAAFISGNGDEDCPTRERIMRAEPPEDVIKDLAVWWDSRDKGTVFIPYDADPGETILGVVYGTQTAVCSEQVVGVLQILADED